MLERLMLPASLLKQACKTKKQAEADELIYSQYLLGIEFVAGLKDEVKKTLRFTVYSTDSAALISHKMGCLDALKAWERLTQEFC